MSSSAQICTGSRCDWALFGGFWATRSSLQSTQAMLATLSEDRLRVGGVVHGRARSQDVAAWIGAHYQPDGKLSGRCYLHEVKRQQVFKDVSASLSTELEEAQQRRAALQMQEDIGALRLPSLGSLPVQTRRDKLGQTQTLPRARSTSPARIGFLPAMTPIREGACTPDSRPNSSPDTVRARDQVREQGQGRGRASPSSLTRLKKVEKDTLQSPRTVAKSMRTALEASLSDCGKNQKTRTHTRTRTRTHTHTQLRMHTYVSLSACGARGPCAEICACERARARARGALACAWNRQRHRHRQTADRGEGGRERERGFAPAAF